MGAPSTVALTDDGGLSGSPPAQHTCQAIVPTALFTPDLPPSTCDKLVTTIPIALYRAPAPVKISTAAASVSTSTGGLLSLTEPIMEYKVVERIPLEGICRPPTPHTGRGHPGVCAEPLRLDDGGWFTSSDFFKFDTDDGGRPIIQLHAPRANEGPVPGAPVWDRCHSATPARLASIIAHRKGPSSAHDSSISNAAASASPSPGHFCLPQPLKDSSKSSGAAALDPGSWPRTPTGGVRVETVRHDDDGHALAGGIVRGTPPPSPGEPRDDGTSDLPPSTCDKLVTTIPIALHRETTPVMNNAAASVSTSTGGLLSLTEPTMEIRNREDPKRRDQPPCSIPPTGRGHPGVCAEPLRLDDGGWFTSPDFSEVASRATAATRPAFSGAPLVVLVVYISI